MLLAALLISSKAELVRADPAHACDQLGELSTGNKAEAVAPLVNEPTVVVATVKGIDRLHGIVHLDSEIGRIVATVDPVELQRLHAGDQIIVVVSDEDLKNYVSQDSIMT